MNIIKEYYELNVFPRYNNELNDEIKLNLIRAEYYQVYYIKVKGKFDFVGENFMLYYIRILELLYESYDYINRMNNTDIDVYEMTLNKLLNEL